MYANEAVRATPTVVYTVIVLVLLGTVVAGWFAFVQPYFLLQERKNVTHSHQYIEGKKALVRQLNQEYADNQAQISRLTLANKDGKLDSVIAGMENQQIMLKIRIRDEMSLITGD